jgi:hypothetical protein
MSVPGSGGMPSPDNMVLNAEGPTEPIVLNMGLSLRVPDLALRSATAVAAGATTLPGTPSRGHRY